MTSLTGQRVMITGASGFIGRHLSSHVLAAGGSVIGLSRRHDAVFVRGCTGVTCDLENSDALRAVVVQHSPDLVFHLAAYVTAKEDPTLVLPMMQGDLNASVSLFSALRGTTCRRIVQTGTCLEVDDGEIPASPYGVAKACSRLYAIYYARYLGLPVVHARLDMIYGPGQPQHRLVPYLLHSLVQGKSPILREPTRTFAPLHIDDAVAALIECASSEGLSGETVDIAGNERIEVREMARVIEGVVRGESLEPAATGPAATNRTKGWTWRAKIPFTDGIKQTFAQYPRGAAA